MIPVSVFYYKSNVALCFVLHALCHAICPSFFKYRALQFPYEKNDAWSHYHYSESILEEEVSQYD